MFHGLSRHMLLLLSLPMTKKPSSRLTTHSISVRRLSIVLELEQTDEELGLANVGPQAFLSQLTLLILSAQTRGVKSLKPELS